MLFSLLKHHFDLNIIDTALKVSRCLYCFTTSIFHGVESYFPRLWGTGISDAIFDEMFLTMFGFVSSITVSWFHHFNKSICFICTF